MPVSPVPLRGEKIQGRGEQERGGEAWDKREKICPGRRARPCLWLGNVRCMYIRSSWVPLWGSVLLWSEWGHQYFRMVAGGRRCEWFIGALQLPGWNNTHSLISLHTWLFLSLCCFFFPCKHPALQCLPSAMSLLSSLCLLLLSKQYFLHFLPLFYIFLSPCYILATTWCWPRAHIGVYLALFTILTHR